MYAHLLGDEPRTHPLGNAPPAYPLGDHRVRRGRAQRIPDSPDDYLEPPLQVRTATPGYAHANYVTHVIACVQRTCPAPRAVAVFGGDHGHDPPLGPDMNVRMKCFRGWLV